MVNYLAKFIPNLSSHTIHLCKLLEKDSVWSFENIHGQEIDILKNPVTKPTSLNGLKTVLEQKHDDSWYPVGYGTRYLTSAEMHCHQLEKEILLFLLVINFK